MRELEELQVWYSSHCDGDWEHQQGIKIDTLDNPGWRLTVDLTGTELEEKKFLDWEDNYEHETDWLRCWLSGSTFEATCGPNRLSDAIRVFLNWSGT